MWLINCRTLTLEEFINPNEVKYAILSHTWEKDEEVQYQDFRSQSVLGKRKRGWEKIRKTCELALNDSCDFAWVDTCCIDKSSSAELSEALNSMMVWYAASQICHLPMPSSRWFNRGWTLQELIAPASLRFYNRSWISLGTKSSLLDTIWAITSIPQSILLASEEGTLKMSLSEVPVARRMAWAAKRETTRTEDIAYSLLGLFEVNLPLLYGEGERAFTRLQEEIIKTTNDLSILAWVRPLDSQPQYSGVFAPHPRFFQAATNYVPINDLKFMPEFSSTNKGLKIETQLTQSRWHGSYVLYTNCIDRSMDEGTLGIFLKHEGASVFSRALPDRLAFEKKIIGIVEKRSFFLDKGTSSDESISKVGLDKFFHLPRPNAKFWGVSLIEPRVLWDDMRQVFITTGLRDFVGYHRYTLTSSLDVIIIFGYGYGYKPWVRVGSSHLLPHFNDELQRQSWRNIAIIAFQYFNASFDTSTVLGTIHAQLEFTEQRDERGLLVKLTHQ